MTQLEITGDPVQLGTDGPPLPKETHLAANLEQHGERFWQRYHLTLKVPWKLPITLPLWVSTLDILTLAGPPAWANYLESLTGEPSFEEHV